MVDSEQQKPEIIYPCQWTYSIMGQDEEDLLLCVGEVMRGREHKEIFCSPKPAQKIHRHARRCSGHRPSRPRRPLQRLQRSPQSKIRPL